MLPLLLTAILAATTLTDADKQAITEANKFVVRGNEFTQKGSLTRAKVEYQRALKIAPQHLDALYNLAVTCEKLGENDQALDHYKKYLTTQPGDPDVWTQLGALYDKLNKKSDAQAAYEKAIAINPNYGLALHNLGVMLQEKGDLDAAQKYLEQFVALEDKAGRQNGDAYYSLASLYLARGNIKNAKLLLQKALDTDPSVAYYNNAMGDVYIAEKQTDLALTAYQKALDKDPKYAPAYSGLGDAYRQRGDLPKAAESYKKALELRPDYALVHYRLGLLYEETQPADAIKQFEKYLASGKTPEYQTEAKAKIEKLKNVTAPKPQGK